MIFEGTDSSLGCIASMDMGWYKLEFAFVGSNSALEGRTCFVVHDVDCGRHSYSVEACINVVVGRNSMTVVFRCKRAH